MKSFDVYPLFPIEPIKGEGSWLWDTKGDKYLDYYGGHAVISIGHSHPYYVQKITDQLNKLAFYSNSVIISLQQELGEKLGITSGHPDYNLFLCNSGAEANENALKLASFHTGKAKAISFSRGFHGRTSLAVALTDNASILAPINRTENAIILPFNDEAALEEAFEQEGDEICAVIVEGIQGVGGIHEASIPFLRTIRSMCDKYGAVFIADSVQCGYGRTGTFFAHDHADVKADIYSMAKGMGNGFPIGGIAIAPHIEAKHGMLGTTFGGNHLACAAAIAVLDVMQQERIKENVDTLGAYLKKELLALPHVTEVRGRGLMLGVAFDIPAASIRNDLLYTYRIFTGSSSDKFTIRLLPALNVGQTETDYFLFALKEILAKVNA